jgi:hypothetical protein
MTLHPSGVSLMLAKSPSATFMCCGGLLTRAVLVALANAIAPAERPSPWSCSAAHEAGFRDGCTTVSQGRVPCALQRNEMLYASEADYRSGWMAGHAQCRSQAPNSPLSRP